MRLEISNTSYDRLFRYKFGEFSNLKTKFIINKAWKDELNSC